MQDETTLTRKSNNNGVSNLADTKPPPTAEHIRSLLRDTNMKTLHRTVVAAENGATCACDFAWSSSRLRQRILRHLTAPN